METGKNTYLKWKQEVTIEEELAVFFLKIISRNIRYFLAADAMLYLHSGIILYFFYNVVKW